MQKVRWHGFTLRFVILYLCVCVSGSLLADILRFREKGQLTKLLVTGVCLLVARLTGWFALLHVCAVLRLCVSVFVLNTGVHLLCLCVCTFLALDYLLTVCCLPQIMLALAHGELSWSVALLSW